jgi:hypothetical protein
VGGQSERQSALAVEQYRTTSSPDSRRCSLGLDVGPLALGGEAIFKTETFQQYVHPSCTERQPATNTSAQYITLSVEDLVNSGRVHETLPDVWELVSLQVCDLALKKGDIDMPGGTSIDLDVATRCSAAEDRPLVSPK